MNWLYTYVVGPFVRGFTSGKQRVNDAICRRNGHKYFPHGMYSDRCLQCGHILERPELMHPAMRAAIKKEQK